VSAGVNAVNGSPNSSDSMQSIQNISVGRPGVDVSADTINGSLVGSVYYMVDGAPIGISENNSAALFPPWKFPKMAWRKFASKPKYACLVSERRCRRHQPGHQVWHQ